MLKRIAKLVANILFPIILEELEEKFKVDLNGDGIIGRDTLANDELKG